MDTIKRNYVLCDTPASVRNVVEALRLSPQLILDCEGKELGTRGGVLSLITLRTTNTSSSSSARKSKTFIVDAIALTDLELRPILDILEDVNIPKIVFDGRMDWSELHHGYSVDLQGVLDLQLADVVSRQDRGMTEDDQFGRLSPYIHRDQVLLHPKDYRKVHRLSGLEECAREHQVGGVGSQRTPPFDHSRWLHRPLAKENLNYAARDVRLIAALFNHFTREGYMYDALGQQSSRYIELYRKSRKVPGSGHPLLPLDIITEAAAAEHRRRECQGCKRSLTTSSFPKTNSSRHRQCWVCRAHTNPGRQRDRRYVSEDDDDNWYPADFGMDDDFMEYV